MKWSIKFNLIPIENDKFYVEFHVTLNNKIYTHEKDIGFMYRKQL
jgi:hypothetical protein